MAICSSVFYACNKQTNNPESTEPTAKKEAFTRKSAEVIRALTSGTTSAIMSIDVVGSVVQITTTNTTPDTDDNYGLFYPAYSVAANSAGEVTLPVNSTRWWMVPFDNTKTPIEITAIGTGPSYDIDCYCTLLGTCEENQSTACETKNTANCTSCEKAEGSCCSNCKMMICNYRVSGSSPWITQENVSYRLVNADVIEFNGVTYPELPVEGN